MEVYFQLITDAENLKKACEDLKQRDVVGFDTETTELDPYLGNIRLVQLSDGAETKVFDLKPFMEKGDLRTMPELAPLRELLAAPKPVKIAHNAKFDAKWIKHHLGVDIGGVFDTLLASQLIAAGDQNRRHNLAEVAQVFAGIELDKSEQVSDWNAAELSQSQIEYAARDAATMIPLREKIVERLKSDELVKAAKLEFDCVMPIAQMELAGFYLDKERWLAQLEKVKKEQDKVAYELQNMLSAGVAQASLFGTAEINLNSQAQVTDALKNLGVPVPDSTRGWQLQPLAAEYPVVAKLLEYRGVAKNLTSFGENILEFIEPKTGRIHADFRQIGAPTGRFSCLAGDTLVSTSTGLQRIDRIQAGESVKTLYGYKRVEKIWSNGLRQTFVVTLSDGRKIRATDDHLFLTEKANVWKKLDDLKVGDDLFVSLKTFKTSVNESIVSQPFDAPYFRARKAVDIPKELSVEFCEFLGLAFADGFLGKRHIRRADKAIRWGSQAAEYDRLYLAFNPYDTDLIERILASGEKLFGVSLVETKCQTCRLFQLASTRLAEFFARFGLTNSAQTKKISEVILNAPPALQAAFLRGLFEGDGHRVENEAQRSVGLTSINLDLLLTAQIILSHLGIYCTVRARKDSSGFTGNARYVLEITKKSDIKKFTSQVGFLSKRKNRPFNISKQITDGVATPFAVRGAQLYREAVALGVTPASRVGVKPFIQFYKNPAIKPETVEKIVERFGVLPSLAPVLEYLDLGVRQVKIKSIEPFGTEEVFDITVADVHHFVANGIVVHNCNRPNIQQIPHGEEYRRCFRAPEGRKLIIADYSQIELRILAEFSGDEQFIEAFRTGADFHTTTAAQVFNVKPEEVTSDQRSFAKRLNFGVVYGIGASRFAMMTGLQQSEAENIMRRYFGTYRKLDAWLREAGQKVTTQRVARTASGRMMKFRYEEGDRQAIALAQRNGKNMPIQGCVSGKTKIFEKDAGYVSIESLAGREISVWDGECFARAKVAYSGRKQLVKVEFWGGQYIECSPNHKFLTIDVNGRRSWRTPPEFVKGNYVVLTEGVEHWKCDLKFPEFKAGKAHNASRSSLANLVDSPDDLGEWLGRLASDGCVNERQLYLLIADHEKEILSKLRKSSEAFGHVYERTTTGGKGTQNIYSLTTSACGLAGQIQASGIKFKIPDFIWQDSRLLAGYLRGMFDGDGTVNKDRAILTFGKGGEFYLGWARDVQQALLLFGIRSRINRCSDRINVRVLKRDMPVFCRKIGFINPQKQNKALQIESHQHQNRIYGRAVRIKSVEMTAQWIDMYDVVDSETSKFMANGLVTHNSSADILKRALRLLHDEIKDTSAQLVNIVHDEIIVEADAAEAETTAEKLEKAMCAAGEEYISKVPVKVDVQIADEWVK